MYVCLYVNTDDTAVNVFVFTHNFNKDKTENIKRWIFYELFF